MKELRAPAESTQNMPHLRQTNLEEIIGYDVLDKNDNDIGNVTALWTDHNGLPAFIGVRTMWLVGKTHVVPAYGAQVNHPRKHVRIQYTNDDVKNAPNFDPDEPMDYEHEQQVHSYYNTRGPRLPEQHLERGTESRTTGQPAARQTAQTTGETRIPLHEEEIKVGKRTVEAGGVRLRKIVRSETVQRPVEIKREDIVVERVPAGREREPAGKAFEGEDVFIPLHREEAVVEKEAHVREEVRARKTAETERETVRGTVRKEDVEVEDQRRAREKR